MECGNSTGIRNSKWKEFFLKFCMFFQSPVVIHAYAFIFYEVFFLLLCGTILFNFRYKVIEAEEILLFIWTIIYIIEEALVNLRLYLIMFINPGV